MNKIILIVLYLFSANVFANWEFQNSTGNATVYYFKKDDYKGFLGGAYFAQLTDLRLPELIGGEPYMSIYSKYELDCKKRKLRVLTIEYYSKNMKEGRLVTELTKKSDWFGAPDNDLKMYCKK